MIVLYRQTDVEEGLYERDTIERWWDPGRQKEIKQFANNGRLLSFTRRLNEEQETAIQMFLGCKVLMVVTMYV